MVSIELESVRFEMRKILLIPVYLRVNNLNIVFFGMPENNLELRGMRFHQFAKQMMLSHQWLRENGEE